MSFEKQLLFFKGEGYEVILMGDFNTRVEIGSKNHPNIVEGDYSTCYGLED